jgi:hypothetical protein
MDEILSIVNVKGKAMDIASTDPSPGKIPKMRP